MKEDTIGAACSTHEYKSVAGKPEEKRPLARQSSGQPNANGSYRKPVPGRALHSPHLQQAPCQFLETPRPATAELPKWALIRSFYWHA